MAPVSKEGYQVYLPFQSKRELPCHPEIKGRHLKPARAKWTFAHGRDPVKRIDIIHLVFGGRNLAAQARQNRKCHHDRKVTDPGLSGIARIDSRAAAIRHGSNGMTRVSDTVY
jgi:hypothetical protein